MVEQRRPDRAAWEGELFRLLVENVHDYAIFVVDAEGLVRTWSGGCERLLGYTEAEILGLPVDRIFTPEDVRCGVPGRERQDALETGRGEDDRWQVRKDGSLFWCSGVMTPLKGEGGDLRGFAKIMRDRTEWWHAERALRESEARKAAVMETALDAILTIDHEGKVVEFNPAAERMFGYRRDDVLGRDMAELIIPPRYRGAHHLGLTHYLATGEGPILDRRIEIEAVRADGGEFPVELAVTRVPADGPPRFTGYLRDITARKEQERRRAAQLALTQVLSDAPSVPDAAPRILHAVCENLGWDMGAFWLVDRQADLLRCLDVWHHPSTRAGKFAATSRGRTFARGEGLPGRVWGTGGPVRVHDLAVESDFPRQPVAEEEGLHGAFAFPVVAGSEVVGVVEFFSTSARDPDADLTGLLATVAGQVGQFVERKQAEEALRESEERFRAAFDQAAVGVVLVGMDHQTLWANPGLCAMLGYSAAEMRALTFLDVTHPDDLDADFAAMRRLLAEEARSCRYEKRYTHKDGSVVWSDLSVSMALDPSGAPKYVVGVVVDITERKRAEAELRQAHAELEARVAARTAELARANEFLKALLESIQDGIVACDADGVLTLFNRASQEFHGLPPEPLPADRWAEHYNLYRADGTTPLTREEVPLFRALRGERVQGVEMVIAPVRGPVRTLLASGQVFRDEAGRMLGAVASMHDITARKRAEAALRNAHEELERRVAERTADLARANDALREADRRRGELLDSLRDSEERFRTMAESIPQLAWMARPDGHIYWYNKRWHDYTGTTPEAMQGWGWQAVHDPDVLPSVMRRWGNSIAHGEPFDMVFPLRGADGRFRPFLTRVAPVRGEDGRVAHWFGTNTDISDRLRIEEELRAAKDQAEEANRAKTQFLAVLSHELRTPLNPILLAVSALLERPDDPAQLRPTLEMIRQNVHLQARLIDDLLDVMRIVRGKMPLHWEVVDCHRLIEKAIQICRSQVFGGELTLAVELGASRRHVNADPARLQQVFWNLIKNAVKFTPGGGMITIRTSDGTGPGEPGGFLLIDIEDTGIGIEPDILPLIFDPFQQGETTITRKFGGLGLGLAICKGIVEAHGGSITARSGGNGQGTAFRVTLQSLPEPAPGVAGASPEDARADPPDPTRPLRILVVEDEPATLRLMARLLRGLGHDVTEAATIAAAYEAFDAGEFELVVSDIGLPDGTGLDLMRRVLALRGRVPAIALTGYGMEDDIVRSREAGFTAHMTKPIDFTKLEAMIRQVAP